MKHGFSLVELSIVLVILGLLTGGILGGQALMRAAELRSVTTDSHRYQAAVMTFRDKYLALPGDMPNASSFWGVYAYNAGTDTATGANNGNGDGVVNFASEQLGFWRQLALSGLIEGSYLGNYDSGNLHDAKNLPQGKISGYYLSFYTAYTLNNMQLLHVGKFEGLTTSGVGYEIFKPEEVWSIDVKMDDGHPQNGRILGARGNNSVGVTVCTDADAWGVAPRSPATIYHLDDERDACIMLIEMF